MKIEVIVHLDEGTFGFFRKKLETIEDLLIEIKHKENKMATKEELEAAVATVSQKLGAIADSLSDFAGDFQAAVDELKKQIADGGTGPDLGPAVAALSDLAAKADTISTSLATLDSTAEGISGKQTPPPPTA